MTEAMTSSARAYLKELGVLRASMRTNFDDHAAGAEGTILRYFVDANIVAAYFDPAARGGYFPPLETWLDDEGLQLATVTLLLEFLFSRHLHGQDGEPVYMTPSHFQEVGNMAQAIAKKGHRNTPLAGVHDDKIKLEIKTHRERREKANRDIDALYRDIQEGRIKPNAAVEKLYRAVPLLVGSPSNDTKAFEELALIERILTQERLVHAESRPWFHGGLFSPDQTLLRWLVEDLREIRRRQKRLKESTLFADAVSMLQIMMLEAECPPNVKYIFITADDAIWKLYENYRKREAKAKRTPMMLNLRRPRDYVALINVQSMSSVVPTPVVTGLPEESIQRERSSVFDKIQTALGVSATDGSIGDWQKHREKVLDLWRRATGYSVLLYVHLLADRERTLNETLQRIVAQGNVYQALLEELSITVDKIGWRHAVAAIQSEGPPRAPLRFRRQLFHDFIGTQPIDEYLDRLARNKIKVNYDRFTAPGKENEALLFQACIAIAARQWEWAREVAERAFSGFEKAESSDRAFRYESRFCLAMAIRFSMRSEGEFRKARGLLTDCIREHSAVPGQSFRLLRAESESAALIGSYLFCQHWNHEFQQLPQTRMAQLSDECLQHIENAKAIADERLANNQTSGQGGVDVGEQRIGLQVFSNRASLAVFDAVVLRRNMKPHMEQLRFDFKELSDRIERYNATRRDRGEEDGLPTSVTIPTAMLAVIVAPTTQEKLVAKEVAHAQLTEALDGGQAIPEMDRNEFQLYRKWLPQL